MIRTKLIVAFLASFALITDLDAQRRRHYGGHRSGASNAWIFGLNWSFIANDNQQFENALKVGDVWHGYSFPSKFNVEKYITTDFSVEAIAAVNKVTEGKNFLGDIQPTDGRVWIGDVNLKYRFIRFFIIPGFDPYVSVGAGLTRFGRNKLTGNLALGFNTWLANGWGLNFQTSPKLAFGEDRDFKYLHHSFGIIYRYFITDIGSRRLQRQQNLLGGNSPYKR